MKIPQRKGYRPISLDARDPENVRVIQWERIAGEPAPAQISEAPQPAPRRGLIETETQGQLFAD